MGRCPIGDGHHWPLASPPPADCGICQTFAASPAEPGGAPNGLVIIALARPGFQDLLSRMKFPLQRHLRLCGLFPALACAPDWEESPIPFGVQ
jgi:hypothetical protein